MDFHYNHPPPCVLKLVKRIEETSCGFHDGTGEPNYFAHKLG